MIATKKFVLKFFSHTFKDISDAPWYYSLFYTIVDSKYGLSKRLDRTLSEQLVSPHPELVEVAKQLRRESSGRDDLIIRILEYVKARCVYKTDLENFGMVEKWASAYTTWSLKKDDCDGLNALIYVLGRLAGMSQFSLWSSIGDTDSGGHYWLLYFSSETDKWYSIDATYYYDPTPISERIAFEFKEDKYVGSWCVFNENYMLRQG